MKSLLVTALVLSNLTSLAPVEEPEILRPVTYQKDIPIVMYHSVRDDVQPTEYTISCADFESDLEYLEDNGYTTILVNDLTEYISGNLELPEKPIMLTFDDGYVDNYTNVFRLLRKYNEKAVICPITKYYLPEQENSENHITVAQTAQMIESGLVEIANHSYDLHNSLHRYGVVRNKDEDFNTYKFMLLNDLNLTKYFYMNNDLAVPTIFSYPYGAWSNETEKIMKDYGFVATFFTAPASYNLVKKGDETSLYGLTRMNRPNGVTSAEFFTSLEAMEK